MLFSVLSVFSSVLWTVVDGWMDGRELHFLTSTRVAVNAIIISTSRRAVSPYEWKRVANWNYGKI